MYRDRKDFGGSRGGFAPVSVGQEIDVKIEAVGEKGDGIAKEKGFVLFVPGVKEGDEVRIKVTKVLRNVGFAEVVGDAQSSPAEDSAEPEQASEEPQDSEDFGDDSEESDKGDDEQDSENFGEEDEDSDKKEEDEPQESEDAGEEPEEDSEEKQESDEEDDSKKDE